MKMSESAKLLRGVKTYTDDDAYVRVESVPSPFVELGAGASRCVLKLGRTVFKIGSANVNAREVGHVNEMRNDCDLPTWCYIPEAELVDGVCVMEYIEGDIPRWCYGECRCGLPGDCWAYRAEWLAHRYGLEDLHFENVRVIMDADGEDYTLVLIDLGDGCSW